MLISCVVPVYNEGKIIDANGMHIIEYLRQNYNNLEVIFVNDGSGIDCFGPAGKIKYS